MTTKATELAQLGSVLTLSANNDIDFGSGAGSFSGDLIISDTDTAIRFPAADTVTVETNGAERLRVDSSGNVGVGITPSVWGGTIKSIDLPGGSFATSVGGGGVTLARNANFDGTDWRYRVSTDASIYEQDAAQHRWYNAPSGSEGDVITFTQAMTLNATGNLGIGTSSPGLPLEIQKDGVGNTELLRLRSNNGADEAFLDISVNPDDNAVTYRSRGTTSGSHIWLSSTTERMRLESTGYLLIGTDSTGGAGGLTIIPNGSGGAGTSSPILISNRNNTTNTSSVLIFRNAGTAVGSISHTNNSTSYVTASDYRLKENVAPMQNALETVAQLNPVTYTWKAGGSAGQGFIAHELQDVVPDCVTGEKDAVDSEGNPQYQGVDTSFLVATLVAAIQEQQTLIKALEARVAAIETA